MNGRGRTGRMRWETGRFCGKSSLATQSKWQIPKISPTKQHPCDLCPGRQSRRRYLARNRVVTAKGAAIDAPGTGLGVQGSSAPRIVAEKGGHGTGALCNRRRAQMFKMSRERRQSEVWLEELGRPPVSSCCLVEQRSSVEHDASACAIAGLLRIFSA